MDGAPCMVEQNKSAVKSAEKSFIRSVIRQFHYIILCGKVVKFNMVISSSRSIN